MAEVKPEDMVHHMPMDQLQGFEYCIDSNPSWGMYVPSHVALGSEVLCVSVCRDCCYLVLNVLCGVAGEGIALGFQHYILSLGTAVMIPTMLVPLMGGNDVRLLQSSSIFIFLCCCDVSCLWWQ
jgi:nucleobase transporter 1/2